MKENLLLRVFLRLTPNLMLTIARDIILWILRCCPHHTDISKASHVLYDKKFTFLTIFHWLKMFQNSRKNFKSRCLIALITLEGVAGTAGKLEGLGWRQKEMKGESRETAASCSLRRVEAELPSLFLPAADLWGLWRIPATEHILCKATAAPGLLFFFQWLQRLYCPPQNPLSSTPWSKGRSRDPACKLNLLCPQILHLLYVLGTNNIVLDNNSVG